MGAANVKAVYAHWRHLPDRAFRALVYMALVSLDRECDGQPAQLFWEGRDALAFCLDAMPVDPTPTERRTAYKVVDRAIAGLSGAGAIDLVRRAGVGRNAEYALRLASVPVDISGSMTGEDPAHRGAKDPAHRGPEEDRGGQRKNTKENQALAATSPAPVDDAPAATPNDPHEAISCPSCRWLLWEGHAPDCRTPNLRALRGAS